MATTHLRVVVLLCFGTACGGLRTAKTVPAPAATAAPVTVAPAMPVVVPGALVGRTVSERMDEATTIQSADSTTAEPTPAEPAIPPPAWDIDVAPWETHDRVAYFVDRFTGAVREPFEVALSRQTRYAPMIHAKLRAGGLPQDMIYLPLIESWYDPHAYSRAAAVGMWQFMTGTARGVGLRVDWWIDERRDPVRATDGAVLFLNELRGSFGSVYLAAAAYNGGPGRVSRGLVRHAGALQGTEGDALFFALSEQKAFREETRDYVPKLIAAALVGKEPLRYGIAVTPVVPFSWDSVSAPAATPLAAVAKGAGITLDTLLDYNPQILRGMTPPSGPVTWLRVPVGTAEGFAERFAALDAAERTAVKRVVTKEGDYITAIAKKNGLTARQLNWYNPAATRLKNGNLHAGQRILVPRTDVAAAARDVPNPAIERYGSAVNGVHVVKRGDTLGGIARKNGTTITRIKALNRMKNDLIRIGQRVRVR